jgi:hypothetical protein
MNKRSKLPCPNVVRDWGTAINPVTQKPIEGRHAITEAMKRSGCRLVEKGEYLTDKKQRGKVTGTMTRGSKDG